MADIFYPFSREEAKRENRLEDWRQSHQLNVKCARDIDDLITAHAQGGQLERAQAVGPQQQAGHQIGRDGRQV